MRFGTETLQSVRGDLGRLLPLHYDELTFGKERIKLAPDWARYERLDYERKLGIYTARDSAENLIGYACFFLVDHPHYQYAYLAINDVFYIDPAWRSDVWLGYRFLKFIDGELLRLDPDAIKWHVKVQRDFGPMLKRLGYVPEETIYSKVGGAK